MLIETDNCQHNIFLFRIVHEPTFLLLPWLWLKFQSLWLKISIKIHALKFKKISMVYLFKYTLAK